MTPAVAALVDSHAHLDMADFDADRDLVLQRAHEAGVRTVLCPAELADASSLNTILGLRGRYPDRIVAAAGVHPHRAKDFTDAHLGAIRSLAESGAIKAVGEIGLDFYYDLSPADAQRRALREQALLARELGLPLIVHTRQAGAEAADIIAQAGF